MMGIGGGALCVSILSVLRHDISRAVGTSAASGFMTALPGVIDYVASRIGVETRLPSSLGYVNVPAAALLIPMTTLSRPDWRSYRAHYSASRIAHLFQLVSGRHIVCACFMIWLPETG